jgi:hypothetical protein
MNRNGGEEGRVQRASGRDEGARLAESASAGAIETRHPTRESGESTFASGVEGGLEFITQYPFSTATTCFALGLAVGVVGVLLLDAPPAPRWYERIPDSFGRRWLESLLNSLPDSVRAKVS